MQARVAEKPTTMYSRNITLGEWGQAPPGAGAGAGAVEDTVSDMVPANPRADATDMLPAGGRYFGAMPYPAKQHPWRGGGPCASIGLELMKDKDRTM